MAKGGYGGGRPPYHKQPVKGGLVDDPAEQEVVETVVRLRRQGRSYREIGVALAERGFTPKSGREWQPNTVRPSPCGLNRQGPQLERVRPLKPFWGL